MSATRADLVRRVSSQTGWTQRPVDQVVRATLEAIGELLAEAPNGDQ